MRFCRSSYLHEEKPHGLAPALGGVGAQGPSLGDSLVALRPLKLRGQKGFSATELILDTPNFPVIVGGDGSPSRGFVWFLSSRANPLTWARQLMCFLLP